MTESERLLRSGGGTLLLLALLWSAPAGAETIHVAAGGNVQAALNAAACGDTITLEAGATYSPASGVILPKIDGCSTYTVLRTQGVTATARNQCSATGLATIRSTNNGEPTIRFQDGASYWRIEGLAITRTGTNTYGIIRAGNHEQTSLAQVAHHLEFVGNYVFVASGDERRGIILSSGQTLLRWNCFENFAEVGADSQGISGWAGPGPYTIDDNFIEGAGENIIFGGADPLIENLIPTGITITRNTITKRFAEWRGTGVNVKNLIEIKAGRDILIRGNDLRYSWLKNQDGYAVLLTVENQSGGCGWCDIDNVLVDFNVIRDVSSCFQISGSDASPPGPSGRMSNVTLRHNVCQTDTATYGGDGRALLMVHSPDAVTIERMTFINTGSFLSMGEKDQLQADMVIRDTLARHGPYGVIGDGFTGEDAFDFYFAPGYVWSNVALAGGLAAGYNLSYYPTGSGTTMPTQGQFETCFVTYEWPFTVDPNGACAGQGADLSLYTSAPTQPPQEPDRLRFSGVITFESPDHESAAVTGYEIDIVSAKAVVVQTISIPKANVTAVVPATNPITYRATIDAQQLAFGAYTARMRTVAGAVKSEDSPESNARQIRPSPPSRVLMQ